MEFPELDEWDTPKAKLPNCPRCGDDELGVIHRNYMMCYACGWELERKEDASHSSNQQNHVG